MPHFRNNPPKNEPGFHGEWMLSTYLARLSLPNLEVWYNLKLPLTPEIDLVLSEPSCGAYIVEVKGMNLESVVSFALDEVTLADGRKFNPIDQVHKAEIGLRNTLQRAGNGVRAPFLVRSVAWPMFTRAEFCARFPGPAGEQASYGMLFEDDFFDDSSLLGALASISDNHLGVKVPQGVRGDQPGIEILRKLTAAQAAVEAVDDKRVLSATDRADLRMGSEKSRARVAKYSPDKQHTVMFRGYPGSGKTTVLRDVGIAHAKAGKSVLYVCYNKVLAAKVRQEVQELLVGVEQAEILFTVADEFMLYAGIAPGTTMSNIEANLLAPARIAKAAGKFDSYDTILIDECQDASDSLLELVELLSGPMTSTFFVYGDGQQLYNLQKYPNGSPRLHALISRATVDQFNRNFRGGPTSQLVCAAFADMFPDEAKALAWLEHQIRARPAKPSDDGALDFGDYQFEPVITLVDRPMESLEKRFVIDMVDGLISRSTTDSGDVDALVIVGGDGSPHYKWISTYFAAADIPHVDLVRSHDRRAPHANQVKISTYQGARGMTCQHAIVFDADFIETRYTTPDRPRPASMMNIALSRARGITAVYTGSTVDERPTATVYRFLETLLTRLERQ